MFSMEHESSIWRVVYLVLITRVVGYSIPETNGIQTNMSNVDGCGLSETTLYVQQVAYFIAYYVIMPIYFFVGLLGNIVLLIAFYKQSFKEKAYAYQVYLTLSKTLEIFFGTLFWFGYKWNAGVERPGRQWYMNNYILMFYAAHVGCPLANGFIITSLLFSVAMTADRVFAIARPFVYKNINHRKHRVIAVISCAFIGFSTSAFEVKRWRVLFGNDDNNFTSKYNVRYDEEYLNTTLIMALGHTRTVVRLIGVFALIVLNICMAIAFRKRSRKVGQMAVSDKKEQERRAADKTLLILTVYQSCLMSLAQLPHSGYFIAAFISAKFSRCYGIVVAPFADSCIQIADAADFFVIISVNNRIRKAVLDVLPRTKWCAETTSSQEKSEGGDRYHLTAFDNWKRSPSPRLMTMSTSVSRRGSFMVTPA